MSDMNGPPAQIRTVLKTWSNRWRLQRVLLWSPRGFIFGWVLGMIQATPLLFASKLLWTEYLTALIANSLVFMLLFGAASFSWPIRTIQAARFFDRKLNFFDRLTTAMELSTQTIRSSNELRHRLWKDTLDRARHIRIREKLPLKLPFRELAAIAIVALSLIPLHSISADSLQKAEANLEISKVITEETASLVQLLTEIENGEGLDPDTQQAMEAALDETIAQLSQAETLEQAVAALESAQETLNSLGEPAVRNLAETLSGFSAELESTSNSDLAALKEALQGGSFQATAEGLQNLSQTLDGLEDPTELSSALNALSTQLTGLDPSLATSLAEAGEALQAGDVPSAQASLEETAERLSALVEDQMLIADVDEINQLVGASQERVLEYAGAFAALSSQDGQTTSTISGASSMDGDGSGSGAGRGLADSTGTEGGQAGLNPINTENQPGDGGEVPFSSLFVPESLGGTDATGVLLPQQGDAGEQILGQTPGDIQPGAGSTVPYQEVFPTYETAARQAIESGQVPNHLLDLVRSYFTSLEP